MNATNEIGQRQLLEENLERLAAQRVFYSRAKTIRGINVAVVTGLILAAPAAALWLPAVSGWLALAGLVWAIVEMVLLDGLEERNRSQGALIQEDFDTHVLGLSWNDSLGQRPAPEEIIEAGKIGKNDPRLRNWYADVSVLPQPLAVLACQRSCLFWDKRSRQTYEVVLIVLALLLAVGAVAFAYYRDMKLVDFLGTLAIPMLPALQHAVKTAKAHRRAGNEEERLLEELTAAWNEGLAHGGAVPAEQLRRVQDRLYQLRREQTPIPDSLYWLLRPRLEDTTGSAIKRFIADASAKLQLPGSTPTSSTTRQP
jgi:hypothetical protein